MGTLGTALRTGVHDVCNDIAAADRMIPWREPNLKGGVLAVGSFPLRMEGAVIGAIVLFAGEKGYFLEDEIGLIMAIGSAISLALDAAEKEQRRQHAELVASELAAIVESSDEAIIGEDLNGVITSWNHGATKIFGYSADDMIGTSILRIMPADRTGELNQILTCIRRGESIENMETLRSFPRHHPGEDIRGPLPPAGRFQCPERVFLEYARRDHRRERRFFEPPRLYARRFESRPQLVCHIAAGIRSRRRACAGGTRRHWNLRDL
jgi:PAS domain S-box-containing protein